jgi:moderate conductance mechanosensitive channel
MSNFLTNLPAFPVTSLFHLLIIFLVALLLNRLLRIVTQFIIKPAATQTRAAQAREQQTRTLSGVVFGAGSKIVWAVALLTAAQEFGINITPIAALAGLASLAVGFGAQNLVRDIITGFYIILEDQYVVGDTIQVADTIGRVDHLTLRRTVVRDPRGALVTLSNGDIRTVANLSRDWSQTFVDVSISPLVAQDKALQVLETAVTDLRNDASWSQALVDGPRILGLQSYDQHSSTIRVQIRTAPARQDDVARELRRRIQLEFQRQDIPLSSVQRLELVSPGSREIVPSVPSAS